MKHVCTAREETRKRLGTCYMDKRSRVFCTRVIVMHTQVTRVYSLTFCEANASARKEFASTLKHSARLLRVLASNSPAHLKILWGSRECLRFNVKLLGSCTIASCLLSCFIICHHLFQVDVAAQPRESTSKMLHNTHGIKHEDTLHKRFQLSIDILRQRATWCYEAAARFT